MCIIFHCVNILKWLDKLIDAVYNFIFSALFCTIYIIFIYYVPILKETYMKSKFLSESSASDADVLHG